MFDLTACYVERDSAGDYVVHWAGASEGEPVSVYMEESPDRFYRDEDLGSPVSRSSNHELRITNPDKSVRHYFCLESSAGDLAILAERQLPLEGTPNFRDLGGYESYDGRRLKWGQLFRSGKLSKLTDTDLHRLQRLGLTLVCDFRHVMEQELEPSRLGDEHAASRASLPVTPGSLHSFIDNLQKGVIHVQDSSHLMQSINREFVSNQLPQYAEMFRLLLLKDEPVLIHCASGKDRTGFGAALILDVLGVEEDHIIEDYLLTNRYLQVDEEVERLSEAFRDETGKPLSEELLRPLLEVRPEYLAACFEEIRNRYDTREQFFESALDLDETKLATLRERYLH